MNPIRNVVPTKATRLRGRATRLTQLATLFAAVLLGAINCADSGTAPFLPVTPEGYIDEVAPIEEKQAAVAPPEEPAPSASKSAAASAASSSALPGMSVSSIPFAPEAGPFNPGFPGADDHTFGGTTGFPIGFDFKYYGQTYNRFWIASNGAILFTNVAGGACCGARIANVDAFNNLIALTWSDLFPGPGQVTYVTRGTAPNRRLLVNFENVPFFNGVARVTTQAILYERTNVVEIHTKTQPVAGYLVTQGVENRAGNDASFLPGRVRAQYALTQDGVRFTPVGQNSVPTANAGGNAGGPPAAYHYEGVEGTAIAFKGSGSDEDGDPLTFGWDFNGDGVADSTGAETLHAYADNGQYTATLLVSDGRGGTNQASVKVVVNNDAPSVEAGSDVRINAGESADFSGRFSDKGVHDAPWGWTWNVGSQSHYYGTTQEQGAALLASHRFCWAGSFPVTLTVTDKDGSSGSDAVVVTVDVLPVQININPSTIVLNDNGHALVTVRAYSRAGLDATALNPGSIKLTNGTGRGTLIARTGGGLLHWNAEADLNGDGLLDVEMKFRRDQLIENDDLQMTTTKLMLKGSVGDCGEVLGSADVRVKVKAKNGSAASNLDPAGIPPLNEGTTP